jgi:SAM-dependent methyltransferase
MTVRRALVRAGRRVIPSSVLLTRHPWAFAPIRLLDRAHDRLFPDPRPLPPPHLRLRVGAWRLGFDQEDYRRFGQTFWMHALGAGWMNLESNVMELACGAGRVTTSLAFHDFWGTRYTGHYVGFDVDAELIEWCRRNFPPNFRFEVVGGSGQLYHHSDLGGQGMVALADESQDFAVANSLFTHLLVDETVGYLEETARVLRPGGRAAYTFFCMEHLRDQGLIGTRWQFDHRREAAFIESERYPEAAVAYEAAWLEETAHAAGFSGFEIRPGVQSMAILTR